MMRAFSTAATGMAAQQMMVDVIANNLANVNTSGFKRSQVNFQDLLYVTMQQPGTEVSSGINSPSGLEIGSGVRVASTIKVFTIGELQNTANPLDIAVAGEGFLQVTMPNGALRYTRDGSLLVNGNGQLVTATGYIIEPAITVPTDATSVTIEKDGGVNVIDSAGTRSVAGIIQLARFPNPSGLSSEGDNLFAETEASGTYTTGTPGESGFAMIQSGFLEKSNVQMVTELVNLITAQRAYEINSRAIRAGDDMLQTANNIVR
ncbi:MAG: flagellar basal-body rod protein FlgG [Planctomycetes bacterium B3_Pla]|nr:MAG: flagellar basal-body rod protein FlgG [Planctomycetes bacterium B3_Pla]